MKSRDAHSTCQFRNPYLLRLCLIGACCLFASSTSADEEKKPEADPAKLTLERIYQDNDFSGDSFAGSWSESGARYQLWESAASGVGRDLIEVDVPTGQRATLIRGERLVAPGESGPLSISDLTFSTDRAKALIFTNTERVWRQNTRGDYWVLDRGSHELRQLGQQFPASTLMFAKFSPDGTRVAYVHERNLYIESLLTHNVRQLTHSSNDAIVYGTFDWVYEEEFSVRDGFRWSPDGQSIAFWMIDASQVPTMTLVNNTDGLYPELTTFPYPKVGQPNPTCRLGVVTVETGDIRWLDVPGDPLDTYVARMDWIPGSNEILFQQLNRRQNVNHVQIADAGTGSTHTLFTESDAAWVDVHDELNWLRDGRHLTWISERDGWRHVYLVSRNDGSQRLLTPGAFDVIQFLALDEARGHVYFTASPDNPTECHLYRSSLSGTEDAVRLSPASQAGWHEYRIADGGEYAFHTYSAFDKPPVTQLVRLPSHESVEVLADNKKLNEAFAKLSRGKSEFFRVTTDDGVAMDAWSLTPPEMKDNTKYPLLIYVYGEPAGQTVQNRWGGRSFLWHQMMAQQGYIVMSFDNRGTPAPRGREWRKSVYHKVGILGPQDQAGAVKKVLESWPQIDPQRVGIWGWSGGGSSTLHALFKYPDLYSVGVSVAPVPNQRYYDTIYQERYMGLLGDNPDGFIQGSPINFAHQLQGKLLLVHGTGDDNCHYQTMEKLINELILHDKSFDMMAYPNRTHAIREGQNTTMHLRRLMTAYFLDNLPPN
ncbi:MAG: S9 family peptidase [Planctomycetales bacterium]|nr:S9 family peptidase [Planctomycetales bacterium]